MNQAVNSLVVLDQGLHLHFVALGMATIGLALVSISKLWGWQIGFGLRLHFWLCGCQQIVWASSPFFGFMVGSHGHLQYFFFWVGNYGFGLSAFLALWFSTNSLGLISIIIGFLPLPPSLLSLSSPVIGQHSSWRLYCSALIVQSKSPAGLSK